MKRKRKRWVKTKNVEKEEKGETKNAEREEKGKTKDVEKEEKGETKDAEKHGKEEEKIGREEKNNGLEALLTEKLYLCVQICVCWHKNNEKPILNNLEKKENR